MCAFWRIISELGQSGGNEEARGDLLLEEGLTQAAQGNKKATETLQAFLREFPRHKRSAEAWVALAELAFHGVPANLDDARKNLARAAESGPNAAARERADYLVIWIEDAAPNADAAKVIEARQSISPEISDVPARFRCPDEVGGNLLPAAGFPERANAVPNSRAGKSAGRFHREGALFCREIRDAKHGRRNRSTARSSCSTRW